MTWGRCPVCIREIGYRIVSWGYLKDWHSKREWLSKGNDIETKMKKPSIVLLIQISLVYFAVVYTLNGASSLLLALLGQRQFLQGAISCAMHLTVGISAIWLLLLIAKRNVRMLWLYAFLWWTLIVLTIGNFLAVYGLYPPRLQLPPQELWGAAIAEIMHYLWLLMLIVWLRMSKRSSLFLTSNALPALSTVDNSSM